MGARAGWRGALQQCSCSKRNSSVHEAVDAHARAHTHAHTHVHAHAHTLPLSLARAAPQLDGQLVGAMQVGGSADASQVLDELRAIMRLVVQLEAYVTRVLAV